MVIDNAEVQAQGTWGDKKTDERGLDPKWGGRAGQAGHSIRVKSLAVCGDDRTRGNLIDPSGQSSLGGMFNRLISKTRHQIEESEKRTADLKQQLSEIEELFEKFLEQQEPD